MKKVIIKKYENRRLYDTAASRYVNLDEVAQMVRDGADVQVIDAASGEDLTRVILTQIIMEDAKGRDSKLPLDMLRQMVMTSGATSQEALLKYMKMTTEMYQNAYRAFSPTTGTPPTEVEELRRRIDELEKMFTQSGPKSRAKKSPRK